MSQFEYKTLEFAVTSQWKTLNIDSEALEVTLNDLGKEGWELISSTDYAEYGYTRKVILIFKRVRPSV